MKNRCAAYTLAHNEKYFLPLWIKYYSKLFGVENLYILDHQSTDGSTDNLGCNVRVVEHSNLHDNKWMLELWKQGLEELLEDYDYVVCPDADEFIISDPGKYENLFCYIEYMRKNSINTARCSGYEVLHQRHKEFALDWRKPILVSQRKYWVDNNVYDKPIVTSRPVNWSWGRHYKVEAQKQRGVEAPIKMAKDEDLLLVHLHRVDFEACRETALSYYKSGKCYTSVNQYKGQEFTDYFDNPQYCVGPDHSPGVLSKIPERFKDII